MDVPCEICGRILDAPGALIFSPPFPPEHSGVTKIHVCRACWFDVSLILWTYKRHHPDPTDYTRKDGSRVRVTVKIEETAPPEGGDDTP